MLELDATYYLVKPKKELPGKIFVNSVDDEIGVHRQIDKDENFSGPWILTHRRSRLNLFHWSIAFRSRKAALAAAERINGWPLWAEVKVDPRNPLKPLGPIRALARRMKAEFPKELETIDA
jgi:hypothetical protein